MSEQATVDQAMVDGLADEPEKVTPEVIDVDTSAPRPDVDDEQAAAPGATVTNLPVRHVPVEHATLGTLVPLQEELMGVAQLAVTLATSKLVPKALQDKPADVLAIILTGRELGVAPMTATRMFHVINGTVTLAPKIRMAMVRQQGLGKVFPHQPPTDVPCPRLMADEHDDSCRLCHGDGVMTRLCPCGNPTDVGAETDGECSTWHAERHDMPGIIFTSSYTLAMASNVTFEEWNNGSKITKRLTDKDNWKNYGAQMCQWRALGYLLDQAFSEVGTGLYSPDEVGAVTDDQGEPILDVESTEVLVPADTSPAAQARARQQANAAKPPPADPPANPQTIATFKERIAALGRYSGAVDELKTLWTAAGDDGQPKLPPIDRLLYRQCQIASAMIDLIERKAGKGEYGDPAGAPPAEQPADEPAADEPAEAAQEPQEAPQAREPVILPFDPETLPGGRAAGDDLAWANAAPEELINEIADELRDVSKDDIDSRLKAADLSTSGTPEKRRARLAVWAIRRRMERMIAEATA